MKTITSADGIYKLGPKEFAAFFGVSKKDIPSDCLDIINQNNFCFRKINPNKRDEIILKIIRAINSGSLFSVGGEDGKKIWKTKWSEHLARFTKSGYDLNTLTPEFFKTGDIVRYNGDFFIAGDQKFKLNFYRVLRRWLFRRYLGKVDNVYEFGCGTSYNLVELAQLYPDKKLYGLDWVRPALDMIKLIVKKYGYNMHSGIFDMFSPDLNLEVKPNSAFFTTGALEQLGRDFNPFLEFILAKSPKVVIDVNSFVELYDPNKLTDHLTLLFNEKRDYLDGYITALRNLEKKGRIKIHKINNLKLGTLFQNGSSYVIWSPKN